MNYEELRDRTIEQQSDRPMSITREEAEKVCRGIIRGHLGTPMEKNLFNNAVEQLMEEINGADYSEIH